jgi:hypothetical protein
LEDNITADRQPYALRTIGVDRDTSSQIIFNPKSHLYHEQSILLILNTWYSCPHLQDSNSRS